MSESDDIDPAPADGIETRAAASQDVPPDGASEEIAPPETGSSELSVHRREKGLRCKLGMHTAIPSSVWNDGHYFSACQRCGVSLIRTPAESWHAVPSHYRVVWRKRTDDDIVWPSRVV